MGQWKDHVFPSELLASVALEASNLLFPIAIANKNGLAGEIAVRLNYIATELSNEQLYELPADAQQLSERALHELLDICLWPMALSSKERPHRKKNPVEVHRYLCHRVQKDKLKTKQSVIKFCKELPDTIKHFKVHFVDLSDKLTRNADDLHGSNTDAPAYSHLEPLAKDVYPDEVHQLLLKGIKGHASCIPENHRGISSNPSEWHLTRLCLSSGFRSYEDQLALFKIITTSSQMSYWQEITINIPM